MRSLSLVSSAALWFSSGCIAIGPAAGAGVGVGIGAVKQARHEDTSLFHHGAVGALIGAALEAVAVGAFVAQYNHSHGGAGNGDGVLSPF